MNFYGVTDIWTYVMGAFGVILLPGPNSLYVLSVATVRGVRAGYQGALGVFLGDTILLGLTALGAAGLLRTYPAMFMVLKYAGAAYLTWVGFQLLRSAIKAWRATETASVVAPESANNLKHPFKRALVISLLNPKAILFLLSFFVQFIDPGYPLGARMAQSFRKRHRLSAGLSSAVGGLFVWFGAKLATASLN
jgi:leucine efflux protein